MVSPPTLQRHELGKSVHATFLYPTCGGVRQQERFNDLFKPRLASAHDTRHTHRFCFRMYQLETRFARIIATAHDGMLSSAVTSLFRLWFFVKSQLESVGVTRETVGIDTTGGTQQVGFGSDRHFAVYRN